VSALLGMSSEIYSHIEASPWREDSNYGNARDWHWGQSWDHMCF